ncbi:unnamed protein product [Rotaria socialis]|uniref:K Homology domain-containing protein n=1 Tax=Rotaria socialis TaxID=392032 RepID=A0A818S5V9_9BILA|nr:unnamed protein product [Rotaria socialis]CAF3325308.1 unnamed protein product [Rotaria socialis]CAF3667075.1 unnamed protein product [Rotaria socialis]CAF4234036.1 unnamed protein product [Rotaria socialis]CAF4485082.1 unnamed protein product [Rotaria socialis]
MSNQEKEPSEATAIPDIQTTDENQTLTTKENVETSTANEKLSVSDNSSANDLNVSIEPVIKPRLSMPQDIRYSTEQSVREKLIEKYNNYQVSDKNSCNIRFTMDHRQKNNLLGRNEEENLTLNSISKTFNVNVLSGYQNPTKHSLKIFGTEVNVRKCSIDIMNRMFKQVNRSTIQSESENNEQQTTATSNVKSNETEVSEDHEKLGEKSAENSPSALVSTINPESSITEETKSLTAPNPNKEKLDAKDESSEPEKCKFVPLERKPEYTFILLITGQGQEVLKKNWTFFAGSLQQRLNVTVTNPFKLPKFGDKQWQNELSITGELYENIVDAALQITAFINDVLGIPIQPYKDEEQMMSNNNNYYQQRTKTNNSNNDYQQQQRRQEHNNGYRQSPPQYQGQPSPYNNQHERTIFNRGRNGTFEQIILIRSNCAARIVGTRGSNLRRIQTKCHLRDIVVARHPSENGYVECTLSAYQTRNLNFAIDTIRSYLRNEDDQAVQVLDSHFVDTALQSSPYQNSPYNDQTQQNLEHGNQHVFSNSRYQQQQQSSSFTATSDLSQKNKELGFMTRPLHLDNGAKLPQPSYNFQNTPSFDFTHRPTSASRKTDKRPGEVNDFNNTNTVQTRSSTASQCQQHGGSSSSNSSSSSPRHKSKRTCPETKEIDCTTDDGFWVQKQYYHALDDASKELFDSLLDKLEKIRISSEENAVRKQQRLVGRNRSNKSRVFTTSISSITQSNDDIDTNIKSTQDDKTEESTNVDEQQETKDSTSNELETTAVSVAVDQK